MSTNPLRAQIELIFALRCTVYEIEAILIRCMCDLKMTLKGHMKYFVHICLLTPWGPKMSLFLLYDAPFTREVILIMCMQDLEMTLKGHMT